MKHYIIIALLSFATVGAMKAETEKDPWCFVNCKIAQNTEEECRKLCSESKDIPIPEPSPGVIN